MDNTELFLDLYKQLEQIAIRRYGFPDDGKAIYNLSLKQEFASFRGELDYCRAVRGILQHRPRVGKTYAVEPSDDMVSLLRTTVEKVKNPPKAKDIAVPISSVLYKSMDDLVLPTMLEMQEKVFTHVPILKDGIVVGVFSENTLFSFLADDRIVEIADEMRFSDLSDYLPLERHRAESFRFVRQNKLVAEISGMFEDALSKQDRIGLVFTTNTGKSNEPLLGIITAWDIAAYRPILLR